MFVRDASGELTELRVDLTDTVARLKLRVHDTLAIPSHQQHLMWAGAELRVGPLGRHTIREDAVINLIMNADAAEESNACEEDEGEALELRHAGVAAVNGWYLRDGKDSNGFPQYLHTHSAPRCGCGGARTRGGGWSRRTTTVARAVMACASTTHRP